MENLLTKALSSTIKPVENHRTGQCRFPQGTLVFMLLCICTSSAWSNTYIVSNTSNSGAGSLRQAISDANANPGADVINFSVAGTLTLLSNMQNITGALTIDGTTAPGYAVGTPTFIIDGNFVAISASNPGTLTIEGLDVSKSGTKGTTGISISASSGTIVIKNCLAKNRLRGITCSGNANWTVTGNDLNGSGQQYNTGALEFRSVTTGTITASGNLFFNTNTALYLDLCSNKIIGDENASPAAHIVIKDTDGLTSSAAANGVVSVSTYGCSGLTFDNLDISKASAGRSGEGIAMENSSGAMIIKNCKITNRTKGLMAYGNANWTITGNDLRDSGEQYNKPALGLIQITTGTISASDNLFGGNSNTALNLSNCSNKIIGDENASPAAHIVIKDGDGLTNVLGAGGNPVISTYGCSGMTFDNLDVSKSAAGKSGHGFLLEENSGALTIQNCKIENRDKGILLWSGTTNGLLISCNSIKNCNSGIDDNGSTNNGNSITNNAFLSNNRSVYQSGPTALVAQFNYWGGGAPLNNGANGYVGNVNVSNHLTTAPGCTIACADTDGDGHNDASCGGDDNCPNDPNKIDPGVCGCGVADTDSDGDGTADCNDGCPNDPNKIASGVCGCGVADTDSDGDGTADCNDGCPNDPNKIAPGQCGCGVADIDTDGDGVADCIDNCVFRPNANQADADGDGLGDICDGCPNDPDNDADGDGVCGNVDNCPSVANLNQADLDQDGIGDACDATLNVCSALDGMINAINGSSISSGLKNALTSKLSNVKSKYQNGQTNAAINQLNAFINQVQAQSGNGIPTALANTWIANAQAIIAAIQNGNTNCTGARSGERGATEMEQIQTMEIFPNPATDQLTIRLEHVEGVSSLMVCNQLGEVLWSNSAIKDQTQFVLDLSGNQFSSGLYSVSLVSKDRVTIQRFVVAR